MAATKHKVPRMRFLNGQDFCHYVGLGTVQNPDEVGPALSEAIDLGYRHIDCAALYKNEKEIGDVLKEKTTVGTGAIDRDDFFITSKVWGTNLRAEKTIESLKKTLADLGLKYLDLLLIHVPFGLKEGDDSFPKEEDGTFCLSDVDYVDTWKVFESLVDEGSVRYIGVSNFNCAQLQRLLETPGLRYRPVCNQIEISPYYVNDKLVQFCQRRDTPVVAYAPLGAPARPWVQKEEPVLLEEPVIKKIGKFHQRTPGQVVLRWGVQRGYSVIPKSSNKQRLKENLHIFDFSLTAREMEEIAALNKNQKAYGFEGAKKSPNYPFNEPTHIEQGGSAIM
ncbi:aldo-keto reductase family 1 member B7-like [Ylistrum balloti]|uniref:aldo-keto reductase family 1 member B7-like n=1 Tax=Ylistrum balloti TaxID=509963 RepID=UPI002905B485|nr:aldo-keto reductase family 1 member B7-like [Ylistrum balloti]